jgi:hypothetical protein
MKYDIVLGVDDKHLPHLRRVWPNWQQHKPSLFDQQIIIFYDAASVSENHLRVIVGSDAKLVAWGPTCHYESDGTRWTEPQRQRMLAGFVFVAAAHVKTKYWLKLDLDVVASGNDDWIDEGWFDDSPAIVAHPWGYTKPAYQMLDLDNWLKSSRELLYPEFLRAAHPLELTPSPHTSALSHKRIISWCGFFNKSFTDLCAMAALTSLGNGHLPVPSQDGFMWWMAAATDQPIHRVNMKRRGWIHRSTLKNMDAELEKLNGNGIDN